MFRLVLALMVLPSLAAADWSPRPAMFSYDATFALCLQDPNATDLAAACEDKLAAAYALKRAVAWATFKCQPESLATCAQPFEDEGLPAIAAQIAASAGCEATDLLHLPRIPPDHCAAIASDIMIDEGVVPLVTDITCGIDWIECGDIALINAEFWAQQVAAVTPELQQTDIATQLERNRVECAENATETGTWAVHLDGLICEASRSALLWADLSQTEQDI